MRVLVTGATGFLGANVVRALLDGGHDVRAAVRARSNTLGLDGLEVERSDLSLSDEASVAAGVDGCDAVVHAAAMVWVGRTGVEAMRRVNVDGTATVVRVAGEAGVRLLHVSSVDALGMRPDGEPADEDVARTGFCGAAYEWTKRQAEAVVLDAVEQGLDAVVVNPAYMLGPWDVKPTSGRMLLQIAAGRARLAPVGGNCFLDVRDAARSIVTALEQADRGARYILGGVNLPYFEAWTRIAEVIGAPQPLGRVPRPVTWLAGQAGGLWGRLTGNEPEINPLTAKMGDLPHYFSSARAAAHLGHPECDFECAVADAWQWLEKHGYHTRA